jgi:hypothetical protein
MAMESHKHLINGLAVLAAALVTVALSAGPIQAAGSTVTPSPQIARVGETITLSVTDFKPCSGKTPVMPVVLWDTNPQEYKTVAGSPTSNAFTVDIVVPPSALGDHQVGVGCPGKSTPIVQQQATVKVVQPVLASSPQIVQAGKTVTITGSGFTQCTDLAGNTTVELSANGTPLATASGSNGNFQQVITVPPDAPAGPYPVAAQCPAQPGSNLASTSVNVVTLALSLSSGAPDTTISATGDGYTQCHEVQLQLLRDATQAVAASSPIVPANGSITAEVTVPSSATPGNDYQVDAGCYPATRGNAPIAVEQFTVTSPATSGSPTPSSPSASSTSSSASPSPTQSGAGSASSSGSPSPSTATSPQFPGRTGGLWAPVALIGGTSAGVALVALLLARALSMVHGRRGRGWVSKHLRVVAGRAGPVSADVERRPGATSVSVGLEPHLDHLGNQQYEEATR